LPDWEIILQLAQKMNCPMPYSSVQQVMDEIEELVLLYEGISYTDPEMKDIYQVKSDGSLLGTRRLYRGQFPKGFGRFSPVQYIPQADISQDRYPFTLLAGTILHQFDTGSRSLRASRLKGFQSEAFMEINESDANQLGIDPGDEVRLASPLNEVTAKAMITDTLPQGLLFMPMCFPDSPVNALFDIVLAPRSKTPSLKACAVKLERIGADG
jgi:predicted molibdopterin-dependent oxidoreductase YjgC